MSKKEEVIINTQIRVTEDAYEKLRSISGREDPSTHISSWCRWFLESHANGGLMLTAQDVHTIEENSDVVVRNAKSIVDAVLMSASREDGQFTVKFQIEPAFHETIQQNAEDRGMTVEDLLREMTNFMVISGMYYNWLPDGMTIPISDIERAQLESLIGKKSFTAQDVIKAIEGKLATTA